MQNVQSSLFARPDTMFGVCQALGEDFGFSANWLRVGFAFAVIFNIEYAIAAYVGLGVLVLISRVVYPSRRAAAAQPQVEAVSAVPVQEAPAHVEADREMLVAA